MSCPMDCGNCPCAHDKCQAGAPLQASCDPCVMQLCGMYPSCCTQSWSSACVAQVPPVCGQSCGGPACGNMLCETGETCMNCPNDCGACPIVCGNGACEAGETCMSCPGDCGACPVVCGNGVCDAGETCMSCPNDCGVCPVVCGNGICDANETCMSCPNDCGTCNPGCHSVCVTGPALSLSCDPCVFIVCVVFDDAYCCTNQWDSTCVLEADLYCGVCP